VNWNHLVENREKRGGFVNIVVNIYIPQKGGNLFSSRATISTFG